MDRGYVDFQRLYVIHQAGAFFVTRTKVNMKYHRVYSHPVLSAIRTQTAPMPSYVEHHADVDQIGKLSAEAAIAQYEGAV
jgi:hypothetical protein